MKKICILLILIISNIFSSSDLNQTSLDMFLFKIGFTSLTNEVEVQKKITTKHSSELQKINAKLNSLEDINSRNTIKSSINIHNDKKNTMEALNKKILNLQNRLDNLINNNNISIKPSIKQIPIAKNKNKSFKYAKVIFNNVKVHYYPKSISKTTKLLKKDTILKIQYCNKYQWCKVYKKHEYIAKIRLKF